MARAAHAVASLPGNLVSGGQVRKILDSFLCEFSKVVDDCIHAIELVGRNYRTWRHSTSGLSGTWGVKIGAESGFVMVAAGILSQPLLAGVFPLAQLNDEGVLEPEDLVGDVEVFRNCAGMDWDEGVWSLVHEFVEKGFLKAFGSLPECEEYLGGTAVLSRFGQVTKVRFGTMKRRLMDMLHKHSLGTDEQLDLLMLDFVDAMWHAIDGL